MKRPLLIFLFLALAACGRSTPTNYYMLESGLAPMQVDGFPGKTLRVAMVEGPSYLNRNNIISRVKGEPRLILAEFHLWAEPLTSGVRRVVAETLTEPLLAKEISVLPPGSANSGDYALLLDIRRLDGNFNEMAVFECYWNVLDKNEKNIGGGIFAAEEMVGGASYDALVSAESALARRMGEYLAARLPAMLGK